MPDQPRHASRPAADEPPLPMFPTAATDPDLGATDLVGLTAAVSESAEVGGEQTAAQAAADPRAAGRATAAMLASRMVIAALGWVGSVLIARTLSPDDWGTYTFIFALLGLMAIVTDLGVGRAVMARLIADDPEDVARTESSFIALRILLGALGYVVAVGYVVVMSYPADVIRATALAGLVVIFATPGHALTVIFQSRHRLLLTAVAESLGQTIQLAITIAVALTHPLLVLFVLAPVINEVVALTMKAVGIARSPDLRPSRRIEISRWVMMLTDALPLAIGLALTIAMLKIDVLLLSRLDSLDAVGIYGIGYKFSDMLDTLALAAIGPVATLLVAAWPDRPGEFRHRSRTAAAAFVAAGCVALAAFWPSADHLIGLLYGSRFVVGSDAARLLVVGAVLMSLVLLGIFLLASAGHAKVYPWIAVGGLAVNVGANLLLIPRYSYNGAAVATVLTLLLTVCVLWTVIAMTLPISGLLPLAALAAMAVLTAATTAAGVVVVEHVPWIVVSTVCALVVAVPSVLMLRSIAAHSPADDTAPTATPPTEPSEAQS